jgi:PIN domain nuclease of toxin-antitoxin system
MRRLLDTHLLIWASFEPQLLPADVRHFLEDEQNEALFSMASLWEMAIKKSQAKPDFQYDTAVLHRYLLASGYTELAIKSSHVSLVAQLPWIHRDPFDRMLLAQASVENVALWTSDSVLTQYVDHGFNILKA